MNRRHFLQSTIASFLSAPLSSLFAQQVSKAYLGSIGL
jgi:hypothetical protein